MSQITRYFEYEHLPPNLQEVSKPLGELARLMDTVLPECAEKSAGLRKLLEAKDCFVRAGLSPVEKPLLDVVQEEIADNIRKGGCVSQALETAFGHSRRGT